MKNITLLKMGNKKLIINEGFINSTAMTTDEVVDFFNDLQYKLDNDFTIEDLENESMDLVSEWVDGTMPIYNHEIMEIFKGLEHWEIDEAVECSGWIEYKGNFAEFASQVISFIKYEEVSRAICTIMQECELIEFDNEGMEKVKSDILEYLQNVRDLHIEGLANQYKKTKNTILVDSINEYISDINYNQIMGADENYFDVYKYYYIDLYNDKDIQKAILNY